VKTSHTRGLLASLLACSALSAWLSACGGSAPAGAAPPRVTYSGPTTLTRPSVLEAQAKADGARVVAVTFLLDGRPLGTDTSPPFAFGANPGLIRPGRHRLRVVAVDARGQRGSTGAIGFRTERYTRGIVTASPERGLAHALEALRRGGVTVRLAPGLYRLHDVKLGTGARLVGSGRRTVISAPAGVKYWALLVAKGRNIRVTDLTLDGGGPGPGGGNAIAVFDGSRTVRLQRLDLKRVRKYGVNVWGAHSNVSVQDSRIEGGGTAQAGVYVLGSEQSRDTNIVRSRIRGFRSFGILLGQKEYGSRTAARHGLALDNRISDIRDPARDACVRSPRTAHGCGTNEGAIWTGGVEAAIIGNTIRRARWDGIETVGSSTKTTIVGNDIRTTRTGIYVERSTNDSLISRNRIADVGTGINVEWRHRGGGSSRNHFTFNRVAAANGPGIFVDVEENENEIIGNRFAGGPRPAIILQGSSQNLVRRNRACGNSSGALVREQAAKREDGTISRPRGNRLIDNRNTGSCVAAERF
jgi:parallel beta-helix repeat protein